MLQFSYENTMTQDFLALSKGKLTLCMFVYFMACCLVESTCVVTLQVDLCVFSLVPRPFPDFILQL